MEVVEERQKNGPSNIWVAQRVDPETIGDILAQLRQTELKDNLVAPEKLHTTLAWLKETRKFIRLLDRHCEQWDRVNYQSQREQLIADLTEMPGANLSVPVEGFKYMGNSRRVVVLRLEYTNALKKSREPFIERLKGFLEDVGVRSPRKLMEGHLGLSSALFENYQPHITVVRADEPVDLPNISFRGEVAGLQNPLTKYIPLDNHWHS